MGFQDEKVVAAGDGFSDCICVSPSHVLTFGLLLNFLVFVTCIYGPGLTLRPPVLPPQN